MISLPMGIPFQKSNRVPAAFTLLKKIIKAINNAKQTY
jgi:hypothetical protein